MSESIILQAQWGELQDAARKQERDRKEARRGRGEHGTWRARQRPEILCEERREREEERQRARAGGDKPMKLSSGADMSIA